MDTSPSPTDHAYVVTAVDWVGNESEPSASVYLNFALLPVATLEVVQEDDNQPILSWSHSGGVAGYDLYLEQGAVKVNQELLLETSFVDEGYSGDTRHYTVLALDEFGAESIGREITLPALEIEPVEPLVVKRNIMNRLEFLVTNTSPDTVSSAKLLVEVGGKSHSSSSFSLEPGVEETISVVVGGYSDLPDLALMIVTLETTPNVGERMAIIRSMEASVETGMLVLSIYNEEFTRGISGLVSFTLENTGDEEVEIVTARSSGSSPSNQVAFSLEDEDGNILSQASLHQVLGDSLVTLANQETVARIPSGEVFTSESVELSVPASAPDLITVRLDTGTIYADRGKSTEVALDGPSTKTELALIDTSYYGEVTGVSPENSNGSQDIVISGHAIERSTGLSMANVPLDLVISVNGYERNYEVYTDLDGLFAYTFTPMSGEAGLYSTWAVHPDLLDRGVQAEFVITRVSVSPTIINVTLPRNYESETSISVTTGSSTEIDNLQLLYRESDQPGGILPEGVHITLDQQPVSLGGSSSTSLPISIWADNTAAESGQLFLALVNGADGTELLETITINTSFSPAEPVLDFSPTYIETGLGQNETITEPLNLQNIGLAAMNDIQLTLLDDSGQAAPDWLTISSGANLGSLPVDEVSQAHITFTPSETVAEGTYTFVLRVTSSNYPETDINIFVSVTQSGLGKALFKVEDIYTGTLDSSGQLIQGVSGATVKLQNQGVISYQYSQTTDASGETLFTDIPTGYYNYRVSGSGHDDLSGLVRVKSGATATETVFLETDNLVTVEWQVTEITIEDTYEIVLKPTFETDVPEPVVVIEPASITLPEMEAGEVYYGEFNLTNQGLVAAEDLQFTLPSSNTYYQFELMDGVPDTLGANEVVTIPYRVIALQSTMGTVQDTGGGDCSWQQVKFSVSYSHTCQAGITTTKTVEFTLLYTTGDCAAQVSTSTSSTLTIYTATSSTATVNSSLGLGTVSGSVTYTVTPEPDEKCQGGCTLPPECDDNLSDCSCPIQQGEQGQGAGGEQGGTPKAAAKGVRSLGGSGDSGGSAIGGHVNTATRQYNAEVTDLAVKVQGGTIGIERRYEDQKWVWTHADHDLDFGSNTGSDPGSTITKGGFEYTDSGNGIYNGEAGMITREGDNYKWQQPTGGWRLYDLEGRQLSFGNLNGAIGTLLYDEQNRLSGIADRHSTQVFWFEYDPSSGQLRSVQDLAGRRVEYTWTGTALSSILDMLQNPITYEYDSDGRLFKTTGPTGLTYTVTYDENGFAIGLNDNHFSYDYNPSDDTYYVRKTLGSGKIIEVWYNSRGETLQKDVNGQTVKTFVEDGRDLLQTDENGRVTRREYDEFENLTKMVYPDGSEISYEYDLRFNKATTVTDQLGRVTTKEYNEQGNMIRQVEASGTADEQGTEYSYDGDGNLLTITRLADALTAEAITTMTYDSLGNLLTVTDPEGGVVTYTRDLLGNILTMEDARGKIWEYTYDAMGNRLTQTDPLTHGSSMEYDGLGRLLKTIDPALTESQFAYDGMGNMVTQTDHFGNTTNYEYDLAGNLVSVTDPEGKTTRREYDDDGRLIKVIDGMGNETVYEYSDTVGSTCSSCGSSPNASQPVRITFPTFTKEFGYDIMGRKIEERDILSETEVLTTTFEYNLDGSLHATVDPQGRRTEHVYDGLGRLVTTIDPLAGETTFTYDDQDNLKTLTDPEGQVTTFTYDRNGRLLTETRPEGQTVTYVYDLAGNLVNKLDSMNQKIVYGYDDAGRMTTVSNFAADDYLTPAKTVSYTYNPAGTMAGYSDGVTSATYTYDQLHRKLSETVDYGPFQAGHSYTYYANGQKKSFTGPDGLTYEYGYNDNSQLASINVPGSGFISYTYNWTRPATVSLPGGLSRSYTYDPLMRVESINVYDPAGNQMMGYAYGYDQSGNITDKQTEHGDYQYGYDELSRLTSVDNPVLDDEAYSYDKVGNRLTAADVAGQYIYNQNNELLSSVTTSYGYDANGNTTSKVVDGGETRYHYDIDNRLTTVENDSGEVGSYGYDPFGRRLWKEVEGVRTYFHYSDEGLVGEFDASGQVAKSYGYQPNSTWTTDPIFMLEGGAYYYYQNDHLGTPQMLVDEAGVVVWSASYSAFGEAAVATETVVNNLRFPGQYFDVETGFHYNLNRYYDPNTGRYSTADPIGLHGGINIYTYVGNRPTNKIDPWGLTEWDEGSDPAPVGKPPQTPCPSKEDDIIANPKFTPYAPPDNKKRKWGQDNFHCGYNCYLELNVPARHQQQECCYDEFGDLATSGGCQGSPNTYDGDGNPFEQLLHVLLDPGGIVHAGLEGWSETHSGETASGDEINGP